MSVLTIGVFSRAQNPTAAFPNNYKLVLDNADVAVLRAHYGPHEKVGTHDHSDFTTVYVYLNDSGPVRFTHAEEARPFTVDRPPTHAGAFRVSPGRLERHTVENLSDAPSDYLRIEFKKMPIHTIKAEFRGPAPPQPLLTSTSVAYDNPALRIERVICDPGATCTLSQESAPSVLIAVTPTALLGSPQAQMLTFEQPAGWLPAGARAAVRAVGPAPAHLLRIVLLPNRGGNCSAAPAVLGSQGSHTIKVGTLMAETLQSKIPAAPEAPVPEAWRKTELARHERRPYPMDYIQTIFTDFSEIHGDRQFADDSAMTAGMARFHGDPVLVVGNLKGRSLKERVARKFGSPDPEGYRKALRAMRMAEKFGHPVFTFIDLAGANPGLGAEERGQGEAIARNLLEMSRLRVPTIATITGEGGSGGALALAVADRVLMLENAIYSVISPEGCASIMWKDASKKQQAAAALRYTSKDVQKLGCVDDVIPEPEGGAQNDVSGAMEMVDSALQRHLGELKSQPLEALLQARYAKFRSIAQFYTTA